MQNLLLELQQLLQQDEHCILEGKLLKNKVIELALQLDPQLLKLLLSHDRIKKHFFQEVEGVFVFDKIKFQRFVSNKAFLEDSYTSFKNKIGLITQNADGLYDEFISENKEVVLSWPYKDCVLEGGQTKEDAKRDEVFWNETLAPDQINKLLAPKTLTNFKKYDKDGEHEVKEISLQDNLIIKGNNLLALHSLKKVYAGKIKLIYIDPPYNTGADSFGYNDNFNHSTWLIFMKNRLSIAKSLMHIDGVALVQCSFHEYAYLKVLMDEIFKKHLCTFNIQVRHPDRILTGDKEYNDVVEYILAYADNPLKKIPKKEELKTDDDYIYAIKEIGEGDLIEFDKKKVLIFTPDKYKVIKNDPHSSGLKTISIRGSIREKNSSGRFYVKYLESLKDNYPAETLFKVPDMGDDGLGYRYFYLPPQGNINGGYYQGKPQSSDITYKPYPNYFNFEKEYNNVASEGEVSFRNGKKPEELLKLLIELFSNRNDFILDYHLGSGTTASVAHKIGRKYIGVEQIIYGENGCVFRLQNVIKGEKTGISEKIKWQGGGSFIYCELASDNQTFVESIMSSTTKEELQTIFKEMQTKAFLSYKIDIKNINETVEDFAGLSVEDQKKFLLELLDKNMLYVPYSEIDDTTFGIPQEVKELNHKFYSLK